MQLKRFKLERRGALAFMAAAGWASGCSSTIEVRPAAETLAPRIVTVVGLPLSIGWGGPAQLRRVQRRA
ncbi:MAG TPA: hypothetical protein VIK30_03790, partial [Polyangia bacterium]